MKSTLILPTFILSLTTLPCIAQSPAKYSATVDLVVSGRDSDSLTNQFTSFLGRELRNLGDIRIEHDKPDYVISLVVMKVTTTGSVAGFSAAVLITKPQKAEILTDPVFKLKAKLDDWQLGMLSLSMINDVAIMKFGLRIGSMNDVESTCREIVADFDTETLNPQRTFWDALHK